MSTTRSPCLIRRMNTDKTTSRNDNRTLNSVVARRPRRVGRHYKLSSQDSCLAIEYTGRPYVDRSAMSARAIISTGTIDRVGDLLIPQGCRLDNFIKNPVVLWAHGLEGIGHNMRGKHLMQAATQQPLSLLQRAASVVGVVGSTVVNGGQLLSQEAINARQAICTTCPNYTGSGCQLCGCQATRDVAWSNKLAHASASCPMQPPRWTSMAENNQVREEKWKVENISQATT